MGRIARHRFEWLTATLAVLTACIWTMRGVEAMTMSREPSAKAIVACVAFVCVGLALGAVLWAFPAYRRMQSASGSPDSADRRPLEMLLSGLLCLGIGVTLIFDRAPEVHEWMLMALSSLASGLCIGLSLMLAADRTASRRLDTRIPHP
jgi:hypothetical protein